MTKLSRYNYNTYNYYQDCNDCYDNYTSMILNPKP